MRVTATAAIDDPSLLGTAFAGDSWDAWRAVLRAAEGLPLTQGQRATFRAVADREPPASRVKELWVIAGRRAGKDSIASAIAAAAAMDQYQGYLRPGERAVVMCLAVSREQARIVHRYIAAYFRENSLLQPLVARETDDGLELTNGVDIVVSTNSYRAVRGRTLACVILDEVSFWRDEDAANPDVETYNAVLPGLVTLPSAMLVGITTAYRRSGLAFDKWRKHFGQADDDVLVVRGPSTTFNPSLPRSIIDAALARDPEAAAAEWLSEWRSDLSDFLDRELIEAAVDPGVVVRPPQPGIAYTAFADPSGGRGDSFTCAITHGEGNVVILDCVFERRAPFDPSIVVGEIATLLREYDVATVTGDKYGAQWIVEAFSKVGVGYRASERDRSALYLDTLPLFTAGRARLLDNQRLIHQFASLERRTSRLGKDRVDHGPGGADDCANSVAGALVMVAEAAAPALWRLTDLHTGSAAHPWPVRCAQIFATASVDQRGVFVGFWAAGADRYDGGPRALLIDYQLGPLTPSLFSNVAARLAELAAEVPRGPAAHGAIIARSALVPYAEVAGLSARGDGDAMLAPRDALVLVAAAQIGIGAVKISTLADATSRHLPLPLSGVRPDAGSSAAGDVALLGIGATLPREAWPEAWEGM